MAVLIRRTHGVRELRLNDEWHQPLPPEFRNRSHSEEDPDVIPDPALAPPFVHDLLELADGHRAFTNLDGDGAMRIRSWFLHHFTSC